MILGLLYKAKKKKDLAIRHLNEALRIVKPSGASPMLTRIEVALAELTSARSRSPRAKHRQRSPRQP